MIDEFRFTVDAESQMTVMHWLRHRDPSGTKYRIENDAIVITSQSLYMLAALRFRTLNVAAVRASAPILS